jgi:predicted RecA/RadA family phage recombinase
MAKNYVGPGERIPFIAAAALSSGALVAIGNLFGVVLHDVASGAQGIAAIEGEFIVPKLSTAVITNGLPLAFSVTNGYVFLNGSAATGDLTNACVAVEAAGNGTTTVRVRLGIGLPSIH